MNTKLLKLFIFIVDYLLVHLALLFTLMIRFGIDNLGVQMGRHLPLLELLFILWFAVFYIADLYNITEPLNYRRFFSSLVINVALAVLFFYLSTSSPISPKTNLGLIVILFMGLFLFWRYLFERLFNRFGLKRSLVFMGVDDHSLELAEKMNTNPRLGYVISGFVVKEDDVLPEWLINSSIVIMKSMDELSAFLENKGVHSIVVNEAWYWEAYQHLYGLFPRGIRIFQLSTFWEKIEETIPVNVADELWFLQNMSRGPYTIYNKIKRFVDILIVVVFSPLILFFCLITFLMVKLTSRGPAIYKQIRVGLAGKDFTIYKFRSMRVDAEKNGAVWAKEKDPRLTPVGNFIRRFRLDEVPQFFNILKGDMSFVGPRPERPEFVNQLVKEIPHYNLRHLVKPGLTGWAQVKYRYASSLEDAEVKLMYDLFYVKNFSLLVDFKIALKTVFTIVSRGGR
jgi:exopolysaccharide biosynthesis polyprenyl glycosylphosphotransferase